jgi:hypothetical protein
MIAIIMTGPLIGLRPAGEPNIPNVLSNALTMVLGFYFGFKETKA